MKKTMVCVLGGILLASMLTACGGKEAEKESISAEEMEEQGRQDRMQFENTDYLDTYVQPTELGDDMTATIVELDGYLYQIPCPLTEFTDNGWELYSLQELQGELGEKCELTEEAPAGEASYAVMKKGEYQLGVVWCNMAKVNATGSKCAITAIMKNSMINASYGDIWPEGMLKFPGGLMETSTLKDVDEVCKKFEKTDTIGVGYEYSGDKDGISYWGLAEKTDDGEYIYDEDGKRVYPDDKKGIGFDMHNYNWEY